MAEKKCRECGEPISVCNERAIKRLVASASKGALPIEPDPCGGPVYDVTAGDAYVTDGSSIEIKKS